MTRPKASASTQRFIACTAMQAWPPPGMGPQSGFAMPPFVAHPLPGPMAPPPPFAHPPGQAGRGRGHAGANGRGRGRGGRHGAQQHMQLARPPAVPMAGGMAPPPGMQPGMRVMPDAPFAGMPMAQPAAPPGGKPNQAPQQYVRFLCCHSPAALSHGSAAVCRPCELQAAGSKFASMLF